VAILRPHPLPMPAGDEYSVKAAATISATTAATTSQTPVRASYGVHGVQERSASAAKSPVGSAGSESRAGFSLGSAMPLRAGQHDVFFGERTTNSGRRKANTECPEAADVARSESA
jgi:hypothetical protein